jgi:CheY-like chemotaxis protein
MKKALDILLIEDDIDDVDLLKEALLENEVNCQLHVIMEGDKALSYLQTVELLPEIIVMDLNLPKTDGKEILGDIKSSSHLLHIPVIVLTTSSSREDIDYCNRKGISKFITKPATIEGWNSAIQAIVQVARSNFIQLEKSPLD